MNERRHFYCALLSLLPVWISAQSITLTFDGLLNGTSVSVDSVSIENLTAGGDTMLYNPDAFILGSVGIREAVAIGDVIRSMPNPFLEATEIIVPSIGGEMLLSVHDASGREVAAQRVEVAPGQHRFHFTSTMPGAYIVRVQQNGQRRTHRMIGLQGTAEGAVSLSHEGLSSLNAKSGRSLFSWQPGDELRFTGYATHSGDVLSAVIMETPAASTALTFAFSAGSGAVCPEGATVTDIDGNTYPVVQIGGQCWMAENLRTTRYRDGSILPNVTVNGEWAQLNTGAWCNYQNNASYDATYGKIYNWFAAVDPRGLCPAGWHVPTDQEWKQLEVTVGVPVADVDLTGLRGVAQNAGGKLKATALWNAPNAGANNESGFSGLPAGNRLNAGSFFGFGNYGTWLTVTESSAENVWYHGLYYSNGGTDRGNNTKRNGCCVRCLMD